MNKPKWWVIAAHEFAINVRRKAFIWMTLGLPVLLLAGFGLIVFFISRGETVTGIGYIDQSGIASSQPDRVVITDTLQPDVPLLRVADESAARAMIEADTLDGYVVIPADYLQTGAIKAYAPDGQLADLAQSAIGKFIERSLASGSDPLVNKRLQEPVAELLQRNLQNNREVNEGQGFLLFFVPYLFGFFLVLSVMFSGSYLMTAVVEEKENRIMEILATSVRPFSLMAGKIIGLGMVGIVQIAAWSASVVAIFFVARALFEPLQTLSLPLDVLLLAGLYFIPIYLLVAAALGSVGAAVTAVQEGQQLSGVVSLLLFLPVWLLTLIIENPNGPLAVLVSLAPFTAPISMLQRVAITAVPLWQVVASLAIQCLAALGMVWIAGRVLRIGMLRYGKRLSLRDFSAAVRGERS